MDVYTFVDGKLGLSIARSDDGSFCVDTVSRSGQAPDFGVVPGDVIVAWGGVPLRGKRMKAVLSLVKRSQRPVDVTFRREPAESGDQDEDGANGDEHVPEDEDA